MNSHDFSGFSEFRNDSLMNGEESAFPVTLEDFNISLGSLDAMLNFESQKRGEIFSRFSDITAEYPIFSRASIAENGAQLHVVTDSYLWSSLPVAGFTQPFGALNGGATAYLAESAGSFLANLQAARGTVALGVDLAIHHHLPTDSGRVYLLAKIISSTEKSVYIQFSAFRVDGELIASGSHTCVYRALAK